MDENSEVTDGDASTMSFEASGLSYVDANYCHFSHPHSGPDFYVIFMKPMGKVEATIKDGDWKGTTTEMRRARLTSGKLEIDFHKSALGDTGGRRRIEVTFYLPGSDLIELVAHLSRIWNVEATEGGTMLEAEWPSADDSSRRSIWDVEP